jgi:hypothetical protein
LLAVLTDPGAKKLREAAPVHLAGVRRHFSSKLDSSQLDILGNLLWKVSNEKDDAVECTPAV